MKPMIQTDVSDDALVTAIRANMCDMFRLLSRSDPAEHYENERFTRWRTKFPYAWFNGVFSSGLPADGDDAFIEKTIQYFHDQGVDSFTWWLEPHLKRLDWEPILSKHGFGFSDDTPGMAVDLHQLNETLQPVDGFEVREVRDEESLRTWANTFVNGYGLPSNWESMTFDFWMKYGFDFPIRSYLGYLNGKPISTACIIFGGGAAGIYNVATLPEARGKGLGAAITLKSLQDAREMGYRVGVLQSSEMGFNIYKKLGFRHLCQVENFYLSPQ
jgi:ribosomal protein S18 acetylase RimI-like enzyme